jgi:uncharacterized protein
MHELRSHPRFLWKEPIIDIHAHPRSTGDGKPLDRELTEDMIAVSRSMGVCMMGSLGEVLFRQSGFSAVEIRWLNDRTAELTRLYPFFHPFCFIDPTLGAGFVREEIDRCRNEYGFTAIKLEIACNVAHPATIPVFEYAAELDFPVLVHATDTDHIGNREHQSDPEDVRTASLRCPEARILMAHLTSAGIRGIQALEDLPNISIDTSGMQPDAEIVEYAVSRIGAERVLYGSDMYGRDLPPQIAQVQGALLDDEQKSKIFYYNAARMFGIDPANLLEKANT